ncbi:MAG: hypothetical protein WD970_02055 [Patescibacteria group bacterium]
MKNWERLIKITGILTVLLAALPLFLAFSGWIQVFTPGLGNIDHVQDWVGALTPVFYTTLIISLGIGILQRRLWSAWAWIMIVLLSFPASFVVGYGLFDGGPPYPYPIWLGYVFAFLPIIVSFAVWVLLIVAFRKLKPAVDDKIRLPQDRALIGFAVSLLLIGGVWLWLKDRNTLNLSPEIQLFEHQTAVFFTDPYIPKAIASQKIKITINNGSDVEPLVISFTSGCQDITATLLDNKGEVVGRAGKLEPETAICTQALTTKVLAPYEKVEQELTLTINNPRPGWHALRVYYGDYINTAPVRLSGK